MQFRHLFRGKNAQNKKMMAITLIMCIMLAGLLMREDWPIAAVVRTWVFPVFVASLVLTLLTFALGRLVFRRDKIKNATYDEYPSDTGMAYRLGDDGELVPDEGQQVHKSKNE